MSEWLAGCTRQDFGTSGGSWTRQPAIIVVHSTEGTSFPGYDGGSSAPHFTINVATGERRQHISMGEAARALMNASGGVETNRGGAIQIETIGTCDPSHDGDAGWLYLPKMSAAQAANLGRLMRDIADDRGIPWQCSVTFKPYPASYGDNGVRLSGSAWNSYRGVLGHQHVPENDHGDPGNIDIAAIMGDDDMPLSDDDIARIWRFGIDQNIEGQSDSVQARYVLGRLNPGPEGLGPTVAGAVWDYGTTSAVDGTPQDTVTLLRWAQGDAHNAADYDTGGGVKGRQHSRSDPVTWAAVAALVLALVCFVLAVT